MLTYLPVIAIVLAIIAAGSIAYVAWELTSDDVQKSIDSEREDDAD